MKSLLLSLLVLGSPLCIACSDDGDIGAPCESSEQCDDGLVCDVHDGVGTCQAEHGHNDEVDAGYRPEGDAGSPNPTDPHAIPADASEGGLACAELASVCHPFDRGQGDLGDQCHDIGHAKDDEACLEMRDECVAFCSEPSPDAAAGQDAGHWADAGSDAGHVERDMCAQLGHLCHDLDTGADAGFAHQCHEVGHAGELGACADIYDQCAALCGE